MTILSIIAYVLSLAVGVATIVMHRYEKSKPKNEQNPKFILRAGTSILIVS
ncbi:MAG: hypothetical protein QNK40_08330 [Desulfobacterales bacterium]|nr:hypothetical protein [Desulfobacterales bacterium]